MSVTVYRCSDCGTEFGEHPDGGLDVTCECEAPIIAEAVVTMYGAGGVS